METEDVAGQRPDDPELLTRATGVERRLDPAAWAPLDETIDVIFTPFSEGVSAAIEGAPGGPAVEPAATDLASPLVALLDRHETLRAVVLLSDGDWNFGGSPAVVATRYRTRRIPIHTVVLGSAVALPDLEVSSVDAPTIAVAGKGVQVPFSISSSLPREVNTEVRLEDPEGRELGRTEVRIPERGVADGFVEFVPPVPGDVDVVVVLPLQPGELRDDNNSRSAKIRVQEESLRVLVIESVPRWEFRYLRNALVRDPGVVVNCLLFHPDIPAHGGGPGYIAAFPDAAELAQFDVIFIGDVGIEPGQLTLEDAHMLAGLVKSQASGLVFIPGFRGHQMSLLDSELGDLYPVVLDPGRPSGSGHRLPASLVLTELGRKSLLTRFHSDPRQNAILWETLPGIQWYAPVRRARAGSTVLAVHEREEGTSGRLPLLVTRPYGTGKVLFLGSDGAWRWREGVEDRYHYRFWGQVVRWMAYQRKMAAGDSMRLFFTPERPEVGDRITWHTNAMDDGGAPVEGGEVTIRIESPSGRVDRVRLGEQPGEWGLYSGTSPVREPGAHRITVHCRETDRSLETELVIASIERERVGAPARPEVLEEISRLSRGSQGVENGIDDVVARLKALPEPEPRRRRLQLWSHPIWGGAIIALLCAFWVGRKWSGMI